MKLKNILASAVLLACAYSTQGLAYNFYNYCGSTPVRWSGSSKTMSAAQASFPVGDQWYNALQIAMARINEPMSFRLGFVTGDTSVAIGNGQSEIWFSTDSAYSPAVTFNYTTCTGGAFLTESDVVFYTGTPYTSDLTTGGRLYGYGGSLRPFETTAVHELGHVLNLAHVNTEYNVMGTDYQHLHANGGVGRSYLGEDAADGAIYLYGSSGRQDLSLVHWKWISSSGQYSTHGHTKLYNSSGAELSGSVVGGEKRFDVSGGQTIQVELTAENNGASSQSVQIAFYLSTNNSISTADTLITTQTRTVARDNVDTYRATITLPSGLPSGDYWVGAIIDSSNAVSEYAEDNNATYWPVRYGGTQPPTNTLENGVPKTGLSATTGQALNFTMDVPAGAANLSFVMSGGSGDADMHVRFGSPPTLTTYDCRPYANGNNETCNINPAQAGRYHVMLNAYSSFSGVALTGSYGGGTLPECSGSTTYVLDRNCKRSNRAQNAGNYDYMYINLPAGVQQLKITTSGGTGNANLYVSSSTWATTSNYQYLSTGPGNNETLTITAPPAGYLYISLHAAAAFNGVTISTEY